MSTFAYVNVTSHDPPLLSINQRSRLVEVDTDTETPHQMANMKNSGAEPTVAKETLKSRTLSNVFLSYFDEGGGLIPHSISELLHLIDTSPEVQSAPPSLVEK